MTEPIQPAVVQTNVKQGAMIGGFVCLGLGLAFMALSLLTFFIYGPLFVASFVLSIIAMAQRRTAGGILLLLLTLVVPPVLGVGLATFRIADAFGEVSKTQAGTTVAGANASTKTIPADDAEMTKFRIIKSRFYLQKGTLSDDPIIELSVKNETDHPISRAYFEGTLLTPGRSVPWVKDEFNYEIAGGLEPGESANWRLLPNRFGEWGRAPNRSDMVLTVKVRRLDGPNGEKLFGK